MIVVDASVLANAIGDDETDGRVARDRLAREGDLFAPDLVDVETVAVLRRRWLAGEVTARRFSTAIGDLEDLALSRFPTLPLMRRAYELRANVTAYDAAYVALAEQLDCPLVTADARLAGTPGLRCAVDVITAQEAR
ncbi:MAG TPA: type II toxin-antitoxin system VapC family toxin [Acidimicrobiales bacterium]|nr:type II toxin-antitoxin system VapC family toxin [Acidimicrobiales bacterium]